MRGRVSGTGSGKSPGAAGEVLAQHGAVLYGDVQGALASSRICGFSLGDLRGSAHRLLSERLWFVGAHGICIVHAWFPGAVVAPPGGVPDIKIGAHVDSHAGSRRLVAGATPRHWR